MKFVKIVFLLISIFGFSQDENIIHGSISDLQGLPLPGISIKNLSNFDNSISNFDGDFSIKGRIGDTLSLNYKPECYPETRVLVKTIDNIRVNLKLQTKRGKELSKCKKLPKELYAFIGKAKKHQWENDYFDFHCEGYIDGLVTSKFKIKEVLYGNYEKENIVFSAREHASLYKWLDGDNVLIIVYKFCNREYKKQGDYGKTYKTKNNRWAIPYTPDRHKRIDTSILKPIPIDFGNLSFKSKKRHFKQNQETLIEPYYIRKGRRFYPEMGYYVEDYFAYWKSQQKDWKYSN